ncbi:unnamed protein product [Notodromas monacha]|nr:unnamed protein product [Notodromas monacha]CAG0925531.1 unnamed protein product [Notodromas monacha]
MLDNIQPVPTMSEEILVIAHRDGGRIVVFDDDSTELGQIVTTDLEASNGVVHIVDRVLVRHEDTPRA